jgi:cellobiose-specific phosphotransferase system component IIB
MIVKPMDMRTHIFIFCFIGMSSNCLKVNVRVRTESVKEERRIGLRKK